MNIKMSLIGLVGLFLVSGLWAQDEIVAVYVQDEVDYGALSPGFMATTGLLAVSQDEPETIQAALELGLPVEAPFYPAVYSSFSGEFEDPREKARTEVLVKAVRKGHARKNQAKPSALRQAEDKLVKFLKTEGVVVEDVERPVPAGELAAMFARWGELNASQADAKMAKYQRLLRPVILLGGAELDLFGTP